MRQKASPLAALRSSIAKVNAATDEHGEASAAFRAVVATPLPKPEELLTTAEIEALQEAGDPAE
jgi:hypothetical protein